mmetsp:Transcript_25716/g.79174  ORF Transcript_25716/g.79174 Transcript_25716/m.79174 type:complete len:93 (-) Transcript_25716:31-309(-)
MSDAKKAKTDEASAPAKATEAAKEKRKADIEVYEEDDEFEEFADDDWDETKEDTEDQKLWQDDWDDDDIDDDFCRHLRDEILTTKADDSVPN